jgi:integrase
VAEGIEVRIAKDGMRTYRACIWSNRDGKLIRKSFPSQAAAKAWRQDAAGAVRGGRMRAVTPITVDQAAKAWLDGARDGSIRNRSGDPYKPSAIRAYEKELRLRVLPAFGKRRLTDLTRRELQDFIDRLGKRDMSASSVQCSLLPLRAIYRRAIQRGDAQINPCAGLDLPAVRGRRDRIADPAEAAALLAALPTREQAVWATAMYAGLRRGELRALRWENVDLATGVLRVEHGWDDVEGEIAPKSREGRRTVPLAGVLRDVLLEHRMREGRSEGFVFGRTAGSPFVSDTLSKHAAKAWKAAGLAPITLHECRHTFASMMIAAGVNAKALSRYMGHHSIVITLDLYGHLMPGNEDEAAGLLDAYLQRADTAARVAQLDAA